MIHIKMTGKIAVVNGLDKLIQLLVGFAKKCIEICQLPGKNRDDDNQINVLCLYHRDGRETKYSEHKKNADEYSKLESF